ncbi:class I SAM-dependent methyltransferase [Flavobacterium litorale]|uniref:Class I SAM-dependent methyltransferase n=1 Tax=Flavobacterium litorale TaxID=2856519 RepID=A0ABX8V8W4_9FLAO|nr:class I SAM-dependent methyltransferase [Flavobacterium litorale]QYJ67633.1 class I SAM-dependent methyltransferase [Flavobacterium litorale]
MTCRVCENTDNNKTYEAREMMFGSREKFKYFQCNQCECLQIATIPNDMSPHYPTDYYSFSSNQDSGGFIKNLIKKERNKFAVFNNSYLGKIVYNYFPNNVFRILSHLPITKKTSIIDLGCGDGRFLCDLKDIGIEKVLGVDPFIKNSIEYPNGVRVVKQTIHETEGKWDLIMLHHSFEHMSDPLDTLKSIANLLTEKGVCLIRIPTSSSYAWQHYRENWVQLDAPRHFFLHSLKSIDILTENANLKVDNIIYDSSDFQFWGSEQYSRDIPLMDDKSYAINPKKSIFSKNDISDYKMKADKLNNSKDGDSIALFISKK